MNRTPTIVVTIGAVVCVGFVSLQQVRRPFRLAGDEQPAAGAEAKHPDMPGSKLDRKAASQLIAAA